MQVNDKIYNLDYDVMRTENDAIILSVSKVYDGEALDISTVRIKPITFETIVECVDIMCRNTVTPSSFHDVITDMIYDKIIVD